MGRVVWDVGEAHSTDEAGNDRGGKGPWLKEWRKKRQGHTRATAPQGLIPQAVSGDVESVRRAGEGMRVPWANGSQFLLRKPDAANPHVRFDERDVETEHG